MSDTVGELPSVAGSLGLTFLSLGLVCLLAYVALHWLARRAPRGLGAGMRVLARCQLEPRRQLVAVEVAGRFFLLGSAEGGLSLVAELTAEEAATLRVNEATGLGAWLTEVGLGKRGRANAKDAS